MTPLLSALPSQVQPVVDLALIATLVAFFIGMVKPLIQLRLDPASSAYDSVLQLLSVASGAGLICLAVYVPAVFTIMSESIAVSAGAMGGYRVIKGSSAPAAVPPAAADPTASA
jgi:hypothetical protein